MNISGSTRLICLLGSPVAHSISPAMHNTAFQYHDLDYAYLAFDVGEKKLTSVAEALKEMNVRGFNLTMPDKNLMATMEIQQNAQTYITIYIVKCPKRTGWLPDTLLKNMREFTDRHFMMPQKRLILTGKLVSQSKMAH